MNRPIASQSPNPDLVSVTEAARQSGLSRSSLYRWIEEGRLHQRHDGLVSLSKIERLKAAQRTGRPHGLSQTERLYLVRDGDALAAPFLSEQMGFARLETMMERAVRHHTSRPGGRQRLESLLARLYVWL